MKLPYVLLAAAAGTAAAPPPPPQTTQSPSQAPAAPAAGSGEGAIAPLPGPVQDFGHVSGEPGIAARLPGFAAELSETQRIDGPAAWRPMPMKAALAALASAPSSKRQSARWSYAKSLIASGRAAEAIGVLDVMRQDDPDLSLVDSFALARGAALASLNRADDALAALSGVGLTANAEACAWRIRALVEVRSSEEALRQVRCALPALVARSAAERAPFVVAIADAALRLGKPALALDWLRFAPKKDAAANLRRAHASSALGKFDDARLPLDSAERNGDPEQKMDARLSRIEMQVASGLYSLPETLKALRDICFVWRGGDVEERALRLRYRLSNLAHDDRGAISAAATLIRFFELGPDLPAMMSDVQGKLAALLAPDNPLPIDQAAGLFWDYRDLAPAGGAGDVLVSRLADRLQAAGLYARAAELLQHQMMNRAQDIVAGPLSVRVATLFILDGHPERALGALRDTSGAVLPSEMLWDRARVEAVALQQLGRNQEALAVLQDIPNGAGLRSELLWKQHNWPGLIAASEPQLPPAGAPLSEVGQAIVLRYAIALGMLGREKELEALRTRYQAGFGALPTAAAFDALTRSPSEIDPGAVARAMAAIPTASPAGQIADLLDVAPAKTAARG